MKLYQNCYELTLSRFITCVCDDDLSALIIEGEADENTLTLQWSKIYQEYISLSASTSGNFALTLMMEVEKLNNTIEVIYSCLDILKTYRVDELVEILHKKGYRFPFNADDVPAYLNDLNRVATRAQSIILERDQKLSQLNKIQEESGDVKVTREYFMNWLISLSDHAGYGVKDDITVSEFCIRMNRYIKYCESKTKGHEKGSDRRGNK